jgi:hypothetical protein
LTSLLFVFTACEGGGAGDPGVDEYYSGGGTQNGGTSGTGGTGGGGGNLGGGGGGNPGGGGGGNIGGGGGTGGGGTGGGGNSGLNGTWVRVNSEENEVEVLVLNNGSFTAKLDNVDIMKGTYTASGSTLTLTITQINGAALEEMGLSANQWYNKQQLRTAMVNYAVSMGLSQAQAAQIADEAISDLFAPKTSTYTLSGNTLTIWDSDDWDSDDISVYIRNGTSAGGKSETGIPETLTR